MVENNKEKINDTINNFFSSTFTNAKFIFKRMLSAIPIIIIITILAFTLIQLAPYDAIDTIIQPDMSQSQIDAIKASRGLDKPAYIQYFYWVKGVMVGDFGNSIVFNTSILDSLKTRLPNTIALVLPAFFISFFIAIILGLMAGANKGGKLDQFIDGICSLFISVPTFWFALILMIIFGNIFQFFPITGMYYTGQEPSFSAYLDHLVLPCATLVIGLCPEMIRYVRSSTIGQLTDDYVMVQKAYGSSLTTILIHHVFKNILIPIVTIFGTLLPMLVTGAFVTESIFSWPGVGPYFLTAINGLDYPVIMAVLVLSSTLVILGNLIADCLYGIIDPRIREMN